MSEGSISSDCASGALLVFTDQDFNNISERAAQGLNPTHRYDRGGLGEPFYGSFIVGDIIYRPKRESSILSILRPSETVPKFGFVLRIEYDQFDDPVDITVSGFGDDPNFDIRKTNETVQQMIMRFIVYIRSKGFCILWTKMHPLDLIMLLQRSGIN
jgi:hypothetical protein